MYYIGYNENFANYTEGTASYTHSPSTQRLRIGLAHSSSETSDERDDVDFGPEQLRDRTHLLHSCRHHSRGPKDGGPEAVYCRLDGAGAPTADPPTFPGGITINSDKETTPALQNVRIVNGSDITVGTHLNASSKCR